MLFDTLTAIYICKMYARIRVGLSYEKKKEKGWWRIQGGKIHCEMMRHLVAVVLCFAFGVRGRTKL